MKRHSRTKNVRKFAFVIISLICLVFLPTAFVSAHANLVRSDPERGAVLPQSPKTITIEFSENLDPKLSQVQLLDSHGQIIVNGPGIIEPSQPTIMKLDLPALVDGTYTAVWQTHSVADGHFANGSVGFSIGKSDPNVSLLPAENTPLPTETIPTLPDILIRWSGFLAAALMGGGIFFGYLVWRPAYRLNPEAVEKDDLSAAHFLKGQVIWSAASLIVITILSVLFQASAASSSATHYDFWAALLALLDFNSSWVLWLRIFFLASTILFTTQLSLPGKGSAMDWLVMVLLVIGVLATFSARSHAAASANPLSIPLDTLHMIAMAAWLGGLLPLFLLLRKTSVASSILVPHFTRIALTSVIVIFLTGLYSAIIHVQTPNLLFSTSYGLDLTVKVALFLILVGLGAINFLILTPRLKKDEVAGAQQIRSSVRFELIIGCVLLVTVGILTGSSPATDAVQANQQIGLIGEYAENGIRLRLWLAPDQTGENEIAVDSFGLPAGSDQAHVIFRFSAQSRDLGVTQAEAKTSDGKRFSVRGSYFTLAGNWAVEIILRRPNQNDIVHTFDVFISTDPNDPNPTNPVAASADSLASGKAVFQTYCQSCHGETGKGDGPAGTNLNPPPADLSKHAAAGIHTDGQLFYWISHGFAGTAMPRFDHALTEQKRWDVVNFIRTLGK